MCINRIFLQMSKSYSIKRITHCFIYIMPSSSHRYTLEPYAKGVGLRRVEGISAVGVCDTKGVGWFGIHFYLQKRGPNIYG